MPETVVLLHGFAGTGRGWDLVVERLPQRYRALAPDLRGHGAAAGVTPVSFAAIVDDILALAPPAFVLAGYSMGGRLALHVALAAPDRVRALALISTTGGIEDEAARVDRRRSDEALAARLAAGEPLGAFADGWLAQPLFVDDPPEAQVRARADILRNTGTGLAASLRGTGAGVMEPLWGRLAELTMPAVVVTGERDRRYVALGERLVAALPRGAGVVVPAAGHALPREAPDAVAGALAALDAG